jgi:hypothetical protein
MLGHESPKYDQRWIQDTTHRGQYPAEMTTGVSERVIDRRVITFGRMVQEVIHPTISAGEELGAGLDGCEVVEDRIQLLKNCAIGGERLEATAISTAGAVPAAWVDDDMPELSGKSASSGDQMSGAGHADGVLGGNIVAAGAGASATL